MLFEDSTCTNNEVEVQSMRSNNNYWFYLAQSEKWWGLPPQGKASGPNAFHINYRYSATKAFFSLLLVLNAAVFGKKSREKKGRGEKWPKEKIADGKKAEGENGKDNNMKRNFSTTANIFVRIFFTLIGLNLWTSFIGIIWLDKLVMLFKATRAYHSGGCTLHLPHYFDNIVKNTKKSSQK